MDIDEAFADMLKKKWKVLPAKNRYKWKQRAREMEHTTKKKILKKNGYYVVWPEIWGFSSK